MKRVRLHTVIIALLATIQIIGWSGRPTYAAPSHPAAAPTRHAVTPLHPVVRPRHAPRSSTTSVSVPIVAGWNLLDIPVAGSIDSTAALLTSMNSTGQLGSGAVLVTATYTGTRYTIYTPGYSRDQPLAPGTGIYVYSTRAGTWTPSGAAIAGSTPLALRPGWNLVAAPYPVSGLSASTIAGQVGGNTVGEIVTVSAGSSRTWTPGSTDFTVSPQAGMWVYSTRSVVWSPAAVVLVPPNPTSLAQPVDASVATTLYAATLFLYTGATPIQTGVVAGTIDPQRVAVLRGKVMDRARNPLPGSTVAVVGHPEYGQTVSRADGMFDLVVNGGGLLTVSYSKDGTLPAQRQGRPVVQQYLNLPDVALIPADAQVTTVALSSTGGSMQVAQGTGQTDSDGSRQATLLFPAGTTASMTLPDGTTRALGTVHVRATEYTVGPNGPQAMPATLPPSSGYTYAADYSIDEALQAGATGVQFSQPLVNYVQNFLNIPVGTPVPTGYYDRVQGQWVAAQDGLVIKVLSVTNGMADLDVDGTGTVASAAVLTSLGITDTERSRLAALYTPGTALWRMLIQHFSPWDDNFPFGPASDARPPNVPVPTPDPQPDQQCVAPTPNPGGKSSSALALKRSTRTTVPRTHHSPKSSTSQASSPPDSGAGALVGCQRQSLGESIGVRGTAFSLHYQSDRQLGLVNSRSLKIAVSGASVPASLKRIELEIVVAGRRFLKTFSNAPNQSYTFIWDRKDVYGHTVQGRTYAGIGIGYVYGAVYMQPTGGGSSGKGPRSVTSSFGQFSGVPLSGNRARQEFTLSQAYRVLVGGWDARGAGLGGWNLNVHHSYDRSTKVLYQGDGGQRSNQTGGLQDVIHAIVGGKNGFIRIVYAPDGSLYIAAENRIRRIDPNGIISTVAGNGQDCPAPTAACGDGGPATQASFATSGARWGIALGPDGSLYVADYFDNRVRRVRPNGIITAFAGNGTDCTANNTCGDGGPAVGAGMHYPTVVAVAGDGSVYIGESQRIRRVAPDGTISTVAGNVQCPFMPYGSALNHCGDNGPAFQAGLNNPTGIAIGPDGGVYFTALDDPSVRSIGPDGIIRMVAGNQYAGGCYAPDPCGDGGPALDARFSNLGGLAFGPDGSLYLSEIASRRIRQISPDNIITTIAGSGVVCDNNYHPDDLCGDNGPATNARFCGPEGVAAAPDGSVAISDCNGRIREVTASLPGYSRGDSIIPSQDGTELYVFNNAGRHLRTLEALTGTLLYSFGYDSAGRLSTVTDANGNVTTIQHDASGNPTAIVAPGGQTTTLSVDANGYVAGITDPANRTVSLATSSDGMLSSFTAPKGAAQHFTYDALGRLIQVGNVVGRSTTLTRTDTPAGYLVAITTPLGSTTTYEVRKLLTGGQELAVTKPGGARTVSDTGTDGTQTTTYGDGSTLRLQVGPDPRWGMAMAVLVSRVYTLPSGMSQTTTGSRTDTLANAANPLSLQTQTDTRTTNGRTTTISFSASTHTITNTSAGGRVSTAILDAQGRATSLSLAAGTDPITLAYDSLGRLTTRHHGGQTLTYTYDAANHLTSLSDGAGHTALYAYDAAGEPTTITSPGSKSTHIAYDANGNITSMTMPNGAVHALTYTSQDQLATYAPPNNAAYARTRDADGKLTALSLPGGRTRTYSYDSSGRSTSTVYPEASDTYGYATGDATDRISTFTHTPSTGTAQGETLSYDGGLVQGATLSGVAAGTFSYTHDSNFFLTAMALSSGTDSVSTAITRDADGLATALGPFTFTRSGPGGSVTGIGDGTSSATVGYDTQARETGRGQTVNGIAIFGQQSSYDTSGRVTQSVETIGGASHTLVYSYDADGQLTAVTRDGTAVEGYSYDANGNRVAAQSGGAPQQTATYDSQDRLLTLGSTAYTVNADGYLAARGADTFTYSSRGALLRATVGGHTVTYADDGLGRRVGRTDSAGTTQYLYGTPGVPFRLTAVRAPSGQLSILYYDQKGRLMAIQRGSARYYVATDGRGSPRVVTDATGAVIETLQYDSFGRVLSDSNPAFGLPVGFAGGISDGLTGLVRFGTRDYDPAAGRWTARDPILFGGGDTNLYRYVGNDPVNLVDPTGLVGFAIGGTAGAQIGYNLGVGGELGGGIFFDLSKMTATSYKSTGYATPYHDSSLFDVLGISLGLGGQFSFAWDSDSFWNSGTETGLNTPVCGVSVNSTTPHAGSEDQKVNGFTIGLGPSAGFDVHNFVTNTTPIFSQSYNSAVDPSVYDGRL